MKTLIDCFAAAFCGVGTKTPVAAPHTDETAAAIAVIRAMHGNAKFLKDGRLHVYPIKFRPTPDGLRLPPVTGAQFLFFAGIAAAQGVAFAADEILSPPDAAACAAVQNALGVPDCLQPTPAGGLCCGALAPQRAIPVFPALPEAFAAGALTGAALAPCDTAFIFSCMEPTETMRYCRETLAGYGVQTEDLIDGWRVATRIASLPPVPDKLRRKRKLWFPELRL